MLILNFNRKRISMVAAPEAVRKQILVQKEFIQSLDDPIPSFVSSLDYSISRVRFTCTETHEWDHLVGIAHKHGWNITGQKSLRAPLVTRESHYKFSGGALEILGPATTNTSFVETLQKEILPGSPLHSTPVLSTPPNIYVFFLRSLRYRLLFEGYHQNQYDTELSDAGRAARTWGNRVMSRHLDELDLLSDTDYSTIRDLIFSARFYSQPKSTLSLDQPAETLEFTRVRPDLELALRRGEKPHKYARLTGNKNRFGGRTSLRTRITNLAEEHETYLDPSYVDLIISLLNDPDESRLDLETKGVGSLAHLPPSFLASLPQLRTSPD